MKKCEWERIGEQDGCYFTFCEHTHEFDDEGTPAENGFKYCPFCGREILEANWTGGGEE